MMMLSAVMHGSRRSLALSRPLKPNLVEAASLSPAWGSELLLQELGEYQTRVGWSFSEQENF
jgi:hypothetical protein